MQLFTTFDNIPRNNCNQCPEYLMPYEDTTIMDNRAKAILVLTLLASTSTAVDSDCSINEIADQNPCGGELTCDGDFNDARNTILQMPCLHVYDYDTEASDSYLSHQNFSVSVKAKGFDFFSNNDSLVVNELNDHITDISITDGRIKKVPDVILKLRQATIVDLSSNKIDSLNLSAFSAPSQLNVLNMSYNDIANLAVVTGRPTNSSIPISSIDLSHNNIRGNLQDCIPSYQTLRHLNLSYNYIEAIHPTAIHNMTALLTLDISNNRVIELGSALTCLAKLEELLLNNNNLKSIKKENFNGMTSLQYLNISSNNLKSIENSAFNSLIALSELDISSNQIKVLSKSMFINNNRLTSLDVSFNNILRIESGAFAGAHIEDFKLHNNTLTGRLDTDAFNGLYFEKLDLSDGDITELGPHLFGLNPSFQTLNFSKNIICKISDTALRQLRHLTVLDLSYNILRGIDFDSTDLTNLTDYYINNNSIKKITKKSFKSLISVKVIDLSNNAIEDIESMSFENLKNLRALNLKNNPLSDIHPQTFIGLTSCYSLDLSGTKIKQLKNNVFIGLESLNTLNLSNSDIRDVQFNAFSGTRSIQFLDLSNNQIESLFINNTNVKLQQMLLSGNNIRTISKTSFQTLQQVSLIDLSNNKISEIQPGSFRDCDMLRILNISNNLLPSLQFGVFDGMEHLHTIDLSNNMLQRFNPKILYDYYVRDRYEIEAIYLDNNYIRNLNFTEFEETNVRVLSIGGNFITCDALAKMSHDYETGRTSVVAKRLNFETENVNGIACKSQTELENGTQPYVDNALTWKKYLEKLANQNVYTNRYLAGILAALLCAMFVSLGSFGYFKFRSMRPSSRTLSASNSNQELTNAMELE